MRKAALVAGLPLVVLLAAGVYVLQSEGGPHYVTLHGAVMHGDLAQATGFIRQDPAAVNSRDGHDETPLHAAVKGRHVEAVKLLLSNGADVNAKRSRRGGGNGNTPLHYAVARNSPEITAVLLAGGADATATNDSGETPLAYARNTAGDRSRCIEVLKRVEASDGSHAATPSEGEGRERE